MAENLEGIQIPIVADFSDLGTEMDSAIAEAKSKADSIASAITDALGTIKTDGFVAALTQLGESASIGAAGVDQLVARVGELVNAGQASSQTEALAMALQEVGDRAQAASAQLGALVDGHYKASEGAQALIDKQNALDAALQQAIVVLGEIHDAYTQGAVSADVLAAAEKNVDDALRAANPSLESIKANLKDVGQETESAADRFAKFGEAMAAVAGALAFAEGLKSLGMAAIEAADHVDDATQAMAKLGGGAAVAQETVAQLRVIASDEALSFPGLLVASQRMTAFLSDATKVPAVMQAAGDAAAIMGTNIETSAKAIERFAAGGDISAKSLKALGLTMADMAGVLGTTEANAKKAFAALDQSEKVDAVVAALGKFNGAAKQMNDDALGALVRLGQSWSEVLEEIGKALDPVIKALADFAKSNIVEPIRNLVAAFNELPAPVKDFAVAIGVAAVAIVPVAAGIAGVALAIPLLTEALANLKAEMADLIVESGVADIAFAEILLPIAAVAAAIALLEFTGLGDDIMAFLQGPIAALKEAFTIAAETVKADFAELGSTLREFYDSASGLLNDLGPLIKESIELSWKPLVEVIKALGDAFGIVTPQAIEFKDVVHAALTLTGPIAALEFLNKELQALKAAIDIVRPAIQLLSGDFAIMKQAAHDAADAQRLQQDLAGQNARLLADQAMGLNKVTEATSAYAAGLATLQEHQQKLNDAVTQTKGVLEAAQAAYDGTAKSQQVINAAMADYEKAVKAANVQTQAAKDAHKELATQLAASEAAVASFDAKVQAGGSIKALQVAFENAGKAIDMVAKENLPAAIKAVDDYTAAQLRNGAGASVILEAFSKESELIKKLANESLPLASAAELKLIDTLGQGVAPLGIWNKALADEEAILQKLAKESFQEASDAWDKLIQELEKVHAPLTVLNKALEDHQKFLEDASKSALAHEAAMNKLAAAYANFNLHGPEASKLLRDASDAMERLGLMAVKIPEPLDAVNKALSDAGVSAQKAKNAFQDLATPIEKIISDLDAVAARARNTKDWSDYEKVLESVDQRFGTLSKVNLPAAVTELEAVVQEMIKAQAPADLIQQQMGKLGSAVKKMADEQLPGAQAAWAKYLDLLRQVPSAIQSIQQAQEQQLEKDREILAAMQARGDAYGYILDQQAKVLQEEINIAEKTGGDANQTVMSLEAVRLEYKALQLESHGYGDAAVQAAKDVMAGFGQMSQAMAGAIIDGKNLGDAMVGVFKNIAKSLLNDLIKAAFVPLEIEMAKMLASLLGLPAAGVAAATSVSGSLSGVNLAAGEAAGGLKALAAAAQEAAAEINASSASASGGGSGGGGLASTVGAIGAVVAAGAAVASAILLAHISSDTGHIEVNTREVHAELLNVRADAWSQFGQLYDRLGELKNDADSMRDSLLRMSASGAGGGIGDQALGDLDNIALNTRIMAIGWPTMQGALQTIAGDIVTGFGYVMSDLDVMVQRLGQLVTSGLTSHDLQSATEQLASASHEITDSIDDASDATGTDLVAHALSVNTTAIDISNRNDNTQAQRDQSALNSANRLYDAAHSIADQVTALRSAYDADTRLMNDALKAGNLELAEQYRIAAQNVQEQLLPLLSDTAVYTRDAAAASEKVAQAIPGVGIAATGAGTLVSMHVDKAAVSIGTTVAGAVTASTAALVGAFATLAGSLSYFQPGRNGGGAVTPNPSQPLNPTNPTNPTNPGGGSYGGTPTGAPASPYGAPAPSGTAGPVRSTSGPDPVQQQQSGALPMLASGGAVTQTGAAVVDKNEYMLNPTQTSLFLSAMNAALSGASGGTSGPDYPAILKQAELTDQTLQRLEEQVAGLLAIIAQQTSQGAPPAMMALLAEQLKAAQQALLKYELQMGYQKEATETSVAIQKNTDEAAKLLKALQDQLLIAQNKLANDLKELASAQSSGAPAAIIAGLQAMAQKDALAISQLKDEISKAGGLPANPPMSSPTGPPLKGGPTKPKPPKTDPSKVYGTPEWAAANGIPFPVDLSKVYGTPEWAKANGIPFPGASPASSPSPGATSSLEQQIAAEKKQILEANLAEAAAKSEWQKRIVELQDKLAKDTANGASPETLRLEQQQLDQLKVAAQQDIAAKDKTVQALMEQLAVLQRQLAALQSTPPPSTSGTSAGGGSELAGSTLDQATLGFYAGALAELEDIRNAIHAGNAVLMTTRDAFMVLGKNLGTLLTPHAKPGELPSFDLGGPVPYNMAADLHGGEYVIPADITGLLRQMVRTPTYSQVSSPSYDHSRQSTKVINISAPITINGARGGRENAQEFVAHLRRIVPDANGFSS